MRARFYLTFASTMSLSLLGIVTAAPGCGDTEDAAATPTSSDATTDGKASGDAKSDAAPIECLDADITQFTVPDAAAGDAGVNLGACVGCIKTNCTSELQGCQADCDCRETVIGVFACVGQGKALTACGAGLLSAGSAATSLGLCALNSGCAATCAPDAAAPPPPADAGVDAAVPTDAAGGG